MSFQHRRRLVRTALCVGLVAGLFRVAHAQTYVIQASGVINSISGSTQNLDGSIKIGTPYTYTFVFSRQATDVEPNDPLNGQYELPGDTYGATVTVGDYTLTHTSNTPFNGSPADLFVGADPTITKFGTYGNNYIESYTDAALVTSTNPNAIPAYAGFTSLILLSNVPFGLTSDAQPDPSAYNITHFNQKITPSPFGLTFYYDPTDLNNNDAYINGTITKLSATPEPSATIALALGALGLSGLVFKARRRKANRTIGQDNLRITLAR